MSIKITMGYLQQQIRLWIQSLVVVISICILQLPVATASESSMLPETPVMDEIKSAKNKTPVVKNIKQSQSKKVTPGNNPKAIKKTVNDKTTTNKVSTNTKKTVDSLQSIINAAAKNRKTNSVKSIPVTDTSILLAPYELDDDGMLSIGLKDADIIEFLQWGSDIKAKTIIVHGAVKGKKVTIHSGAKEMNKKEAYQFFLSTLLTYDLTAIETTETIQIIPANKARSMASTVVNSTKVKTTSNNKSDKTPPNPFADALKSSSKPKAVVKSKQNDSSMEKFFTSRLSKNAKEDDASISINLDNADIHDLIQWGADITGKTIIISHHVKGKVTVIAGEDKMTKKEAYTVFLQTLRTNNFTVIETEKFIRIIPAGSARSRNTPIADSTDPKHSGLLVVRVLKPKNVTAQQLVSVLRPLIAQEGHFVAFAETNALIIADFAKNIDRIVEIIQRIDKAGRIDIDILTLEHANAKNLIATLKKLLPGANQNNNNRNNTGVDLAVDDRTNSILLMGDPILRRQARALITRLDTPLPGEGNTQVIYINYLKAKNLVPILQGIANIHNTASSKRRSRGGGNKALATGNSDLHIQINQSEQSNALIITAPPNIMRELKEIITKLDRRRPQVLVEAIIVEVSHDDNLDLGIAWFTDANVGTSDNGLFKGVQTLGGTLTLGIDRTLADRTSVSPTHGDGLTLGFYRKGSLRSILRALATDKSVNLLSTPTIVVLENEEAKMLVGSTVPFITGQRDTGNNNANNNLFTTIQREDIGIELKVTPQINEGDSIILDIEQKVENVSPNQASGAADLQTDKREIKTKILLQDDTVLVLGGLIRNDIKESHNKVPLLGEIPYIGKIFQSKKTEVSKTNLMVFIHAKILTGGMADDEITRKRYNLMRKAQQHYVDNLNKIDKFSREDARILDEYHTITPSSKKQDKMLKENAEEL